MAVNSRYHVYSWYRLEGNRMVSTPEQRLGWVRHYEQTRDAAAVRRAFGISAVTLRKWWKRYERLGIEGLADASRVPHHSPNRKVSETQVQAIRSLRSDGLSLTAIRDRLSAEHGLDVSLPTIRKAIRPADQPPLATPPILTPSLFAATLPDDGVTRSLAADITKGLLRPGERLTEDALATRYRVGRSSIRQALRSLAMIGLVRHERNRGAVVATPSDTEIADAYEARRLVEARVVRVVAETRTSGQIEALRAHLRRQSDAERRGDKVTLVHLLTDFHILLASMCGNQFLRGFVETLASTTSLGVLLYDQTTDVACGLADHRALVRLLEAGDGDQAARLMAAHLGQNQQRIRVEL